MERSSAAPSRPPAEGGSALADALFGSTRRRVLGLLFGQPDRAFFVTEIVALAGSGRGAVQRELARLAASGLATAALAGNRKYYRANPASPLFEELRAIASKTAGVEAALRAALEPLSDRLLLALLFGSAARRKDTAASDLDLLLVSDGLALEEVYAALAPAEARLGRRVEAALYTPDEFRRRRAAGAGFLARVLDGPHIVLAGTLDGA